jgi:eukaryotic-like serine/threonine-protein kinase
MSEHTVDPDDPSGVAETKAPADPVPGAQVVGPYRLVQRVGEGGMGEVWLAEQTRPVHRQVALKIIKAGMDTAQVVARFEAERQALAVMDHPAIAHVFDAGATPNGRPYFAMEYVRGEPITEYCTRHRLGYRQRIDLFLQVCDGVQHAHQKGIIHRDVKPSNILVTVQGDRPVPKIIDFGVAKATTRLLADQPLYTELGVLIGTPEYMSPEQAEMSGLDIDTRADVYSLGVILYELLTGALPFDARALRAQGVEEMRRTIREVDPPRPSTRVTSPPAGAAVRDQGTSPRHLANQLRGDLDWIAMKALEKDRTRRYGSASDLAADLRRHLDDQPVLASPPSVTYRTRKFVRRHRFGVTTAATVAALLVVFAATMALQARRIAQERDRANREAATATQVSDFLVGLFAVSDPSEARGTTLTAREILESGARRIEKNLAAQPEVQARLMATMGTVYTNLGLYDRASPLLQQAVTIDRRLLGDDHPATLAAVTQLANLLWYQNRPNEAEQLYRDVAERRRRVLGEEHADTLRSNDDLASVYVVQKRLDEAERLGKRTLAVQQRTLGAEHPDTFYSMNILLAVYIRQERYAEGEPIARALVHGQRRVLGEEHPDTLTNMHNLARLYDGLDRPREAERIYLETIRSRRRVLGDLHPTTILSVSRLAALYQKEGRYADAEALLLPLTTAPGGASGKLHAQGVDLDTVKQLVDLYDAWKKPVQAAEWRAKLEDGGVSRGR